VALVAVVLVGLSHQLLVVSNYRLERTLLRSVLVV
jgi:hypothetical protein